MLKLTEDTIIMIVAAVCLLMIVFEVNNVFPIFIGVGAGLMIAVWIQEHAKS